MEEAKIIYETNIDFSRTKKKIIFILILASVFGIANTYHNNSKHPIEIILFCAFCGLFVGSLIFLIDYSSALKFILTSNKILEGKYLCFSSRDFKLNVLQIKSIRKYTYKSMSHWVMACSLPNGKEKRVGFSYCDDKSDLQNLIYEMDEMGAKVDFDFS